jgi:histidine triad (HIT) family protein
VIADIPTAEEILACPFCLIIAGRAPAQQVIGWDDAIAIVPLNPVTPGHLLVIPTVHVRDAGEVPDVTARTMLRAAELAHERGDANLITSIGPAATQTVRHLHIHYVPRSYGDGLTLPWTTQAPRSEIRPKQ